MLPSIPPTEAILHSLLEAWGGEVLSGCRLNAEPPYRAAVIRFALLHPAYGVALLDLFPDEVPEAAARFRRQYRALAPSARAELPVVYRSLAAEDLWRLTILLDSAFAAEPPLDPRDRAWMKLARKALLSPPKLPDRVTKAETVAVPPAARPLPAGAATPAHAVRPDVAPPEAPKPQAPSKTPDPPANVTEPAGKAAPRAAPPLPARAAAATGAKQPMDALRPPAARSAKSRSGRHAAVGVLLLTAAAGGAASLSHLPTTDWRFPRDIGLPAPMRDRLVGPITAALGNPAVSRVAAIAAPAPEPSAGDRLADAALLTSSAEAAGTVPNEADPTTAMPLPEPLIDKAERRASAPDTAATSSDPQETGMPQQNPPEAGRVASAEILDGPVASEHDDPLSTEPEPQATVTAPAAAVVAQEAGTPADRPAPGSPAPSALPVWLGEILREDLGPLPPPMSMRTAEVPAPLFTAPAAPPVALVAMDEAKSPSIGQAEARIVPSVTADETSTVEHAPLADLSGSAPSPSAGEEQTASGARTAQAPDDAGEAGIEVTPSSPPFEDASRGGSSDEPAGEAAGPAVVSAAPAVSSPPPATLSAATIPDPAPIAPAISLHPVAAEPPASPPDHAVAEPMPSAPVAMDSPLPRSEPDTTEPLSAAMTPAPVPVAPAMPSRPVADEPPASPPHPVAAEPMPSAPAAMASLFPRSEPGTTEPPPPVPNRAAIWPGPPPGPIVILPAPPALDRAAASPTPPPGPVAVVPSPTVPDRAAVRSGPRPEPATAEPPRPAPGAAAISPALEPVVAEPQPPPAPAAAAASPASTADRSPPASGATAALPPQRQPAARPQPAPAASLAPPPEPASADPAPPPASAQVAAGPSVPPRAPDPAAVALLPPATTAQAPSTSPEPAAPPRPDAAARPTPPPAPTMAPELLMALVRRGDAMLAVGDVSAARLLYERAASAGSGPAATAMGRTYDPTVLAALGARGLRPDPATALTWYRRATALGDAEAEPLARRLGASRSR